MSVCPCVGCAELVLMTLVPSDLLPVNVTLAAYGAAIVLGGSVLGLAIYFLATQVRHHRASWRHSGLVSTSIHGDI